MSQEVNMEREDRDKLIQILSELSTIRSEIVDLKQEQKATRADKVRLSLLENRMDMAEAKVRDFEEKYVTQDQFEPIRRIFWIVVGIVVSGIVGGAMSLILLAR